MHPSNQVHVNYHQLYVSCTCPPPPTEGLQHHSPWFLDVVSFYDHVRYHYRCCNDILRAFICQKILALVFNFPIDNSPPIACSVQEGTLPALTSCSETHDTNRLLETGMATALTAVSAVVLFTVRIDSQSFNIPGFILGKLYSNSLLRVLNSRNRMEYPGDVVTLSVSLEGSSTPLPESQEYGLARGERCC